MEKKAWSNRVRDFLQTDSGRVEVSSSLMTGGFAVGTIMLGIVSGVGIAEARDCCSDTCSTHMDSHTDDYYHTDTNTDGAHETHITDHYDTHADCY